MEDDLTLALKKGAKITNSEGKFTLSLEGKSHSVRDAGQQAAIQALSKGPQTFCAVGKLLAKSVGSPVGETDRALAMAAFILDCGDFFNLNDSTFSNAGWH